MPIPYQFFELPLNHDVTSNYNSGAQRVPLDQNGITSQVTRGQGGGEVLTDNTKCVAILSTDTHISTIHVSCCQHK